MSAETKTEATVTLVAVVIGVAMNAVVIGSASSALQSLDAEKEVRRQRMNKVGRCHSLRSLKKSERCDTAVT